MKTNYLLFLAFTILTFFSACSTDIEGIWVNEKRETQLISIQQNDIGYFMREKGRKRWQQFTKVNSTLYVDKAKNKIKVLEKDKISIVNSYNPKGYNFIRVADGEAGLWAINLGMSAQATNRLLGAPDDISTEEEGIERWYYEGKGLLILDPTGVIVIKENYKKERDFSLVNNGMTREQVFEILGEPDRRGKRSYAGPGIQKWFYGKNVMIIFDNKGVVNVVADATDRQKTLEGALTAKQQSYTIQAISKGTALGLYQKDTKIKSMTCTCVPDRNERKLLKISNEDAELRIYLNNDGSFNANYSTTVEQKKDSYNFSIGFKNEVELSFDQDPMQNEQFNGILSTAVECPEETEGNCFIKGYFYCNKPS